MAVTNMENLNNNVLGNLKELIRIILGQQG